MPDESHSRTLRPALNVHFTCCNVYGRIFLNARGDAYAGHCPRCAKPVEIKARPGGASAKIWRAG